MLKDRHNRPRHGSAGKRREPQGRAGRASSDMWGVLLIPSSSPTLWPVYDGVDVNVTSNITWFHLNHDMVSRRIYKLSFYGELSITSPYNLTNGVVGRTMFFFGLWVRVSHPPYYLFPDFLHFKLEKYFTRYPLETKPLGY